MASEQSSSRFCVGFEMCDADHVGCEYHEAAYREWRRLVVLRNTLLCSWRGKVQLHLSQAIHLTFEFGHNFKAAQCWQRLGDGGWAASGHLERAIAMKVHQVGRLHVGGFRW